MLMSNLAACCCAIYSKIQHFRFYFTRYEGFLAGHAFTYDTSKSALLKNNVTLGFVHSDIQGTLSA